jgi:hypothetical protein
MWHPGHNTFPKARAAILLQAETPLISGQNPHPSDCFRSPTKRILARLTVWSLRTMLREAPTTLLELGGISAVFS